MNNTFKLILTVALMVLPKMVSAQKNADPEGFLTYSLPSTSIVLEVEAVQEKFYVGPYAKYAEKYLHKIQGFYKKHACKRQYIQIEISQGQ